MSAISKLWLNGDWRRLRLELTGILKDSAHQSWAQASSLVSECLVAGEDHRSRQHLGVDMQEMWNAMKEGIRTGVWRGASTIEMQLVRTLTGRREHTLRRKVREILLAVRVKEVVPKEWVPGVYLAVAHFGGETFGVPAICSKRGFDPNNLSLREAAEVVARLRYPEGEEAIALQAEYVLRKFRLHFGAN